MYNILIVDDSYTMRKILIKALQLCDLSIQNIFEASHGLEGIKLFQEFPQINLVFVDIHMPIMDGEEMFLQLCQQSSFDRLMFIFVSSESSSSRIEKLLEQGAHFVHKPFTPEELQSALLYALNQRK